MASANRAAHTAGQRQQYLSRTDLFPNGGHRGLEVIPHAPVTRGSADLIEEIADHIQAVLGMVHLRVVLNPIEPPPLVGDGHVGAGIGMGHQSKALGHLCHIVPVAHPGDAAVGQVPEETAVRIVVGHGFSVLPGGIGLGGGDLPAQGLGHELAAVADTQHGHAQRKNCLLYTSDAADE